MVWYSLFVRSFADSNGDGIGDIAGLTNALDYFSELGVDGIWLLPIHPAPSYHKYDVINYYQIDPEYGTLKDFKKLLKQAHRRGIKIMLDMVFNHSSELHPWFQHALQSKKNHHRNWYVWKNAGLVTSDEQYHWHRPEQGPQDEKYYGLFWKGMPDFNFDEVAVRKAITEIACFWIDLGVDALRLDAAMHIFPPGRENDNIKWWQEFRAATDEKGKNTYLVGEITESCGYIAPHLQQGLHSAFNFELAEHIIQALLYERHDCLADWLKGVQDYYQSIDKSASDAIFLSNHDQIRIASRLDGHLQKIKLAASLLLTLSGEVFLYYGEELATPGEKPDEHLREPFLWSRDENNVIATWIQSKYATPEKIKSLEEQRTENDSVFNHYKTLLNIRNTQIALQQGRLNRVACDDPTVIIFTRDHPEQRILVMHNLSGKEIYLQHEEQHTDFKVLYGEDKDADLKNGRFLIGAYSSLIIQVGS